MVFLTIKPFVEENIVPGGGLLGESNPGSIDPSTGVVN